MHTTLAMFSTFWIMAVIALGVALDLGTWSSWAILTALALLPPVASAGLLWNGPDSTLSQEIQQVLRKRP